LRLKAGMVKLSRCSKGLPAPPITCKN